jgi:hypothetical protein
LQLFCLEHLLSSLKVYSASTKTQLTWFIKRLQVFKATLLGYDVFQKFSRKLCWIFTQSWVHSLSKHLWHYSMNSLSVQIPEDLLLSSNGWRFVQTFSLLLMNHRVSSIPSYFKNKLRKESIKISFSFHPLINHRSELDWHFLIHPSNSFFSTSGKRQNLYKQEHLLKYHIAEMFFQFKVILTSIWNIWNLKNRRCYNKTLLKKTRSSFSSFNNVLQTAFMIIYFEMINQHMYWCYDRF